MADHILEIAGLGLLCDFCVIKIYYENKLPM